MAKNVFFLLAIFLLSLNFAFAQDKTDTFSLVRQKPLVVDTKDATLLNVQNVGLTSVVTKTKDKFEQTFQLSFLVPASYENLVGTTGVVITAYKADGKVQGRHIWCKATNGSLEKLSDGSLKLLFKVDSKLEGAENYSLSLYQSDVIRNNAPGPGGTGCQSCANLANDVCGRGSVASVTCTEGGGCSFTCKP